MDLIATILATAKKVSVSGHLLLAICAHESRLNPEAYVHNDGGSPSLGVCQVKESSARQMGFRGNRIELMKASVNSLYAAKYLKYQMERYDGNWVKSTAAYNSGTYLPSQKNVGCPKNLKYIKHVQKKLRVTLQHRLECGR